MSRYYYRVNQERLKNGKPPKIRSGLYKGNLEIHILKAGLENPDSIPIMLERDIPWVDRSRSNILIGTQLTIEFKDGTAEYDVVCDYDTIDSQCVIVKPAGANDCNRHLESIHPRHNIE